MLNYEQQAQQEGYDLIIGVDEAGRGPLAGPVVAAAVHLKDSHFIQTIRDSKKISASQRDRAFVEIYDKALVGVGIMSEAVIDQVNILQATFLAMRNAVEDLLRRKKLLEPERKSKTLLLIDGNQFRSDLPYANKCIIKGDQKVLSIACASIVAKVTRDRILDKYDQVYPEYGFKKHKGYGTKQHKEALMQHGPSQIHRQSFRY